MVVDDHEATRHTMRDILTEEGYEVMLARNARDATEQLAERVPHLLLTEVGSPEPCCTERLIEQLRGSHPHLPILVLTSHLLVDAEREAQRLGVNGYINKPIDIEVLLSRIQSSLAQPSDVA